MKIKCYFKKIVSRFTKENNLLSEVKNGKSGDKPSHSETHIATKPSDNSDTTDTRFSHDLAIEELSYFQDKIYEARALANHDYHSALKLLRDNNLLVKIFLIKNKNEAYQRDAFHYLTESLRQYLRILDNFNKNEFNEETLSVINEEKVFLDDAFIIGADNKNILTSLSDIYYFGMKVALNNRQDYSFFLNKILNSISLLANIVDLNKNELSYVQVQYANVAETLIKYKHHQEATDILNKLFNSIDYSLVKDNADKRELAVYYGMYVCNAQRDSRFSTEDKIRICRKEIEIDKDLYKETNTLKSAFDLAIAYAHLAETFYEGKDINNCSHCHFEKLSLLIHILNRLKDEKDSVATKERVIKSYEISIQPLINCALLSDPNTKIEIMEELHGHLKKIIHMLPDQILFYGYYNCISEELFKICRDIDAEKAEYYLFEKVIIINQLVDKFEDDEAILNDGFQLYKCSSSYIEECYNKLSASRQSQWNTFKSTINSFSQK